tara:strand:- start:17 stop:331 length:315 start_codon:yes stop_codon:yes gene_type:complete
MEVWDPKDEMTVLSQIKKLIAGLYRVLKTSRYLLYPGVLLILVFLLFGLLSGCASMDWPWKKDVEVIGRGEDSIIVTDLDTIIETDDTANTIACIKLKPECKLD